MFHVLFTLQMGTCQVSCEGQCEAFGKLLEDSLLTTTVTGEALDEPVIMNVCVYVLEWITSACGDPLVAFHFPIMQGKKRECMSAWKSDPDNLAIQKATWHD